jgi:protein required for attachment to host cells
MASLVVLAPPRMLGLLRKTSLCVTNGHLEEIKGDLMGLTLEQLADHPLVRDLVRTRQQR